MARAAMIFPHSTRKPSLWQIWSFSALIASLFIVLFAFMGHQQLRVITQHLVETRAQSVVETIVLAVESFSDRIALQRFVTSLAAERDVKLVLLITGQEQRIIAASRLALVNQKVADLSDAHLKQEITDNWHKMTLDSHRYLDQTVDVLLPIRLASSDPSQLVLEDGMVVVTLDGSELMYQANRLTVMLGASFMLVLAILFGFWALMWQRFVLRPVDGLREAMDQRVQGNAIQAPSADSRELSELIDTYNEMLSQEQAAQGHIRYLSEFDTLTGLPNLSSVKRGLNERIALGSNAFAVVLLDLDRFKQVNEALGHDIGNELLQQVARRLETLIHEGELLARMSGDEFALLLAVDGLAAFRQRLESMLAALSAAYILHGNRITAHASMGVTFYPNDGQDASVLMSHADAALYQAKANGRNTFVLFKADEGKSQLYLLRLEADLRNAIEQNQLQVYYQPQVDVKTNRIVGVEALIRWLHPELGMISPVEFIPLAEETGLILSVGQWVLEQACAQAKTWHQQGMSVRVAVNVSFLQFVKSDYVQLVREVLDAHQLPANLLELELTESIMALSKEQLRTIFEALKAMGVQLAIDDFGTGFSSLSYLDAFPLDRLKIDQSFIRSMDDQAEGASLGVVKAVIELANAFGLSAIAEGVETQNQLAQLQALGCEEFQGYFCSRPLPADAFTRFYIEHEGLCHEGCHI
jgi:diguanylate cyclase (GGDEF)-like protein